MNNPGTVLDVSPQIDARPQLDTDPQLDAGPKRGPVLAGAGGVASRPNVADVRGQIPAAVRDRSTVQGLLSFLTAATLYGLTLWGALAAPWWPLQLASGLLNGLFIGMIFIVGHDACHGGLTPYETLNHALGRVAFWPSLTPFTTWEYAHNRIHHSYTNWRGKDYAWAPWSKDEYDQMTPWRRCLERHYRSLAGLGTYYLVEYWWKHLMFLRGEERREMKRTGAYLLDLALVLAFAVGETALVLYVASNLEPASGFWDGFTSPLALIMTALVLPFAMWNWFMSFAIFQHHNHPRVAWFLDRAEWDFFAGQVENTVHVVMPWYLEFLTAHIMQHTAHHVDPRIPLYRLTGSQQSLEEAFPTEIVVECWTFATLAYTLARCKLYDYDNHRWLNFRGRPTTAPNPIIAARRERRDGSNGSR